VSDITVLFPVLLIGFVLCAFGAVACDAMQCDDLSAQSGKVTKYSPLSGCYVKVDDKWIPEERWRTLDK
jgi:hypothetical protein